MSAHQTGVMEPIPARRMGHYTRTPDFQRRATLLLLGPDLPGAACKGKGNLWDADVEGEPHDQRAQRINTAIRTCRACPIRTQCHDTRQTSPHLGPGVWGGHLFENPPTQRLCACGCGQPLPADAHPLRRYYTRACRQRVYLSQPDKKAAERQQYAARDQARRARRKEEAAA